MPGRARGHLAHLLAGASSIQGKPGSATASGWRRKASWEIPSATRGAGREKWALASTATARQGSGGKSVASRAVRSASKPQGASTTSSGDRPRTAAQVVGKDAPPARPKTSSPPASATIFRHPVPGGEGRIEPFGGKYAAPLEPGDELPHPADLLLHLRHDCGSAIRYTDPLREREDALLDLGDCPRVERDDLSIDRAKPSQLAARDGTDGAEVLGDDQVRIERRDQLLVDGVERDPVRNRFADRAVDLDAPHRARVDPGGRDDGQSAHLRRPVALGRDADEAVGEAETADDLGRAREERADPHPCA